MIVPLALLMALMPLCTSLVMTSTRPSKMAPFQKFFLIVLENQSAKNVMQDPYMGSDLPSRGQLLTNYKAVTHPSQPNYIAMVAGSTFSIRSDRDHNLDGESLADRLEEKQKTWKSYQQGYPGNCYTGSTFGRYVRKHNPFISFINISQNSTRCANIVNANRLQGDVDAGRMADYTFYTPDLDNDGHDTNIGYTSTWLQSFLEPLLKHPNMKDTLFLITYDEDDYSWWEHTKTSHHHHHQQHHHHDSKTLFTNSNMVYSLLLGAGVTPGSKDATPYTHYSQLRTIEQQWGLRSLYLNDVEATPFQLRE